MQICEVTEPLIETKIVWAKKGKNKITRKYRCTFGKRKGRAVSSPGQCPIPNQHTSSAGAAVSSSLLCICQRGRNLS